MKKPTANYFSQLLDNTWTWTVRSLRLWNRCNKKLEPCKVLKVEPFPLFFGRFRQGNLNNFFLEFQCFTPNTHGLLESTCFKVSPTTFTFEKSQLCKKLFEFGKATDRFSEVKSLMFRTVGRWCLRRCLRWCAVRCLRWSETRDLPPKTGRSLSERK